MYIKKGCNENVPNSYDENPHSFGNKMNNINGMNIQ